MKLTAHFQNPLRRFCRDDQASLSVEAVLILPLLFWAFIATFSFFDVYRDRNLAMKANYAVADLLSRETNPIDMDYMRGIEDVYQYLTQSGAGSWVRVTAVKCHRNCANEATRQLRRDWSRATDGVSRLSNANVNADYRDMVPIIPRGERVIMVETQMQYSPPFNTVFSGVTARDMNDISMTRPRFGPQLCWVGRRCGND